ncbi:MAG TPA: PAS domain-containing sensor histidine kinase [Candidatus Cloacimonadota bacterium]|nr:PAS domain-containing sensor histidine kinase [Candidatus Cloacimonadota bacterium]HPN40982.1 PAS domain-containing sensor histidine kinase [Candidatus Cloacimonadota bacterium]
MTPNRSKTQHLPFAIDGVEAFNQLLPEMMKNLLHNLPGIAYRCKNDSKWTMLFMSEGCFEVTGYFPEEILYNSLMSYGDMIYEDDRALVRDAVSEGVTKKRQYRMEYRIIRKDGSLRWVWEQGSAVYRESGSPLYLDGFITDVTHRRELETMLKERADQLSELNQMKDRFFSTIVHDLQNPVYSFISLSDFICQNYDHFKRAEIMEFLTQIRDAAQGMNLLLNNLMDWTRVQTGKMKLQKDFFRLRAVIEDGLEGAHDQINKKNLNLVMSIPDDLQLETDRQVVASLFRNLLSNAIKYSQTRGKIIIAALITEQDLQLSVQDEGVGIPRAELPDLFKMDRDYRRPGTINESGTGLGLLLVKELMDLLAGRVEVQSRVNKGTKVTLFLPIELKHLS